MALDPIYQLLSKLYSSQALSSMPAPGMFYNGSGNVFGREPLQIQGGAARHAPAPQQEDSGAGGLSGALLAGASLFQQGGPLFNYAGGSSAGSFWGNIMGQNNPGYFNTNTQAGFDAYNSATAGL